MSRFDGVHGADNLVEAITAKWRDRLPAHRTGTSGAGPAGAYPPNSAEPAGTRIRLPLAGRFRSACLVDPTPAHCPMHTNPHLLIFGAAKSGKTTLAPFVPETVPAGAVHARGLPLGPAGRGAGRPSAGRRSQPQQRVAGQGRFAAVNLKKRLPPTDADDGAATLAFVVGGFDVVLPGRRWLFMIVGAAGDAADGTAVPAAADIGLPRVTCQMSQAYKATMWTSSSARIRVGRSDNVRFPAKQNSHPVSSKVKRRPLARHFSSRQTAKKVIRPPTSSLQKKCSQHPKRRLRLFHCRCKDPSSAR